MPAREAGGRRSIDPEAGRGRPRLDWRGYFHKTLRMPPALKAKVADHAWTFEELVDLIDRDEIERKRNPISN